MDMCVMQEYPQPELPLLLRRVAALYPALQGEPGEPPSGQILCGRDNRAALAALTAHWQQAHPEAGVAYWSARSWTLLIWQPVFLAVIAVHGIGHLPALSEMGQTLRSGVVAGFRLNARQLTTGTQQQLINQAGMQLRQLCTALLAELNGVIRMRPINAWRLAADSLLTILCELPRMLPGTSNAQVSAFADRWLAATGLTDASGLMPIHLSDGGEHLALDRRACCFHYLRTDGELCASCPRQSLDVRVERLRQEGDAHA